MSDLVEKVHCYNVEDAIKYGIGEATILYNFRFWINHNKANKTNQKDGRFWTFNSIPSMIEIMPEFTYDMMRRALERLKKKGILIEGVFNKLKLDKTRWYTINEDWTVCDKEPDTIGSIEITRQNCHIDQAELPHRSGKSASSPGRAARTIPDINTDITKDINKEVVHLTEVFCKRLNEKAGTKHKSTTKETKSLVRTLIDNGHTLEDICSVVDKKCAQWKDNDKMKIYLRPSTLLNSRNFTQYLAEGETQESAFNKLMEDYDKKAKEAFEKIRKVS